MADITATIAAVSVIFPLKAEIHTGIAGEAIDAGEVLYIEASGGLLKIADANDAGLQQARGIALQSAGIGQALNILKRGHVAGYDLSSQSPDDQVFLSDTVGLMADAAGTMTVPIGRVVIMTDKSATKVLYAEFEWNTQWA